MTRMHHATLPAALLLSALFLSACASQPKEEVSAPAPVAIEQPAVAAPAQTPAVEQTAAPAVIAVTAPAPKHVVKKPRKAKKKVAKVTQPAMEPAPAAEPTPAPAPIVKEEAPVQEPTPAPVVTAPTPPAEEEGFLKKYWMWLLGLVIAVIALSFFVKKKD